MDITAKNAKLWVNEHKKRDGGTWKEYSLGFSKKNEDGNYINASMRVRFSSKVDVPDDLDNGCILESFSGFSSAEVFTDRTGAEIKRPMIVITSVPQWENVDGFAQLEEDCPF